MSEQGHTISAASPDAAERPVLRTLCEVLASVRFALALVVVIAAACALGTLVPQGEETAAFLSRNPPAGKWLQPAAKLGLTQVFSAGWFIALLCVLSATLLACSARRLATVRRTAGSTRHRALGALLTHVSLLLILAGAVARGAWGEKGQLELREGETKTQFLGVASARPLPFGVRLASFEVETYAQTAPAHRPALQEPDPMLLVQWPARALSARVPAALNMSFRLAPPGETATAENSFRVQIQRYVPDFAFDERTREVMSRSGEPNNPAILVNVEGPNHYHNQRWVFANHPEFSHSSEQGHGGQAGQASPLRLIYQHGGPATPKPAVVGPIKSFKSTLQVVEGGQVVRTNSVEVNRPLTHRGYTFYQSGYNPKDLSWTSLQVVRDPGVPLVYTGFGLMIAGLIVVFYLNPWLASRRIES